MMLPSQQQSTALPGERLAFGRSLGISTPVPTDDPSPVGVNSPGPDEAAQAFDMLLKASLDEATVGADDKEDTEDLRVDGKWDSAEDEDDDSDFSAAEAEDDDEEYLDTHMQHKKSHRRASRGKSVPRDSRPAPMQITTDVPAPPTSAWSGALGYMASLAGTDFVDSLGDIEQQFLAILPERLYLSRTKPSEILSLKCSNRECSNVRGNPKKPNSIYCCSKCQSREQNLRQGRVKNVRRLSAASPIAKGPHKRPARRNSSGSLPKRIYSQTPPTLASPYTPSSLPPALSLRTLPPPIQRSLASGPEQTARDKLSLSFLLQAGAVPAPSSAPQAPASLLPPAPSSAMHPAHAPAPAPTYRPQYQLLPSHPVPGAYMMPQGRAMPRLGYQNFY